jgi:maltooligosyltrehalose trehalohydrolase
MVRGSVARRLPVGAEVVPGGGVHFRVWADACQSVELHLQRDGGVMAVPLDREEDGYFSKLVTEAGPGTLYHYRLGDGEALLPDPASRFQPEGPHGPSQVIDPGAFTWTDAAWPGVRLDGQVLYEMHVGTFTGEGTWQAAAEELPEIASAGMTAIEVMPIAEFAGRFGWGYDGVDLFAPTRLYGSPDDFRRFVDRAHAAGLAVILDVVYNHLGPSGNYLGEFSSRYFTDRYENDWGAAINFDGPGSGPVREFFIGNAGYWVDEFHVDGLRLDATSEIFDRSGSHVLAEISRQVRRAAGERNVILIAENEPQDVRIVTPVAEGGYGMDGVWNDDFHHSARVAATGRNEAYYSDYLGSAQELVSAVKWGYLYQGQHYSWQRQRRGTPAFGLRPATFVNYLQNHDQVANSGAGLRLHQLTSPGRHRALTALLLLAPSTPMLFQGQEFSASAPFLYFADHEPELAQSVREGREEFLTQFRSLATPEAQAALADPSDPATFQRSRLDLSERERHAEAYSLHRDLLRLRKEDPAFSAQRTGGVEGAVLAPEAFVLRFFESNGEDRLLVVNLGRELHLEPAPEPLLAPVRRSGWRVLWSSEDTRYGGAGTPPVETDEGWRIPAHSAVVLEPLGEPVRETSA